MSLRSVSRKLCREVNALDCSSAAEFVYNPLAYARAPHERFLERYGAAPKRVLLVGMNPGPFGMAQTGVPFGDVALVRDFLGIEAPVRKPPHEHPKRPVQGFACPRSEVSGTRLWGWVRDRFGSPERFFRDFFVTNYCPLVFMGPTGKNITPDKLPGALRSELFAVCDAALSSIVRELDPEWIVGIGGFAQKRAQTVFSSRTVHTILHPSPASPIANRGWAPQIERQLHELGIPLPD